MLLCEGIHIIDLLYNKCHWTVCRKKVLLSHNSSICFQIPGILNDLCDCPNQRFGSNIFEIQQYSHSRWDCSKHIMFLVCIYWDPHYRNSAVDSFLCTEKSTVCNEESDVAVSYRNNRRYYLPTARNNITVSQIYIWSRKINKVELR
jgi:hypothetical protein